MKQLLFGFLICGFCIAIHSCGEDTDGPIEEKNITTVLFNLTSTQGNRVQMSYRDLDGSGGVSPTIKGANLRVNTTYTGELTFLDETQNPSEDVTLTIREDAQNHQVFYISGTQITTTYDDRDTDGLPIGLNSMIKVGTIPADTNRIETFITVILKQQLDKEADGVSDGLIGNSGGQTDIEVRFPVAILR